MKNQKGITLVALIIIVVVLLVLAGISVSLVLSNEEQGKTNTLNSQNGININDIYDEPQEGDMAEPDTFTRFGEDENTVSNTDTSVEEESGNTVATPVEEDSSNTAATPVEENNTVSNEV